MKHTLASLSGRPSTFGRRAVANAPRTLAITVVTSKLAASAAIITPPGMPKTRNLASTAGLTPCLMACPTLATVTAGVSCTCTQTHHYCQICMLGCSLWGAAGGGGGRGA